MKRFYALLFFTITILRANAADRPNFIFILADDLGWKDLGCYGSSFYETPNLDRLAKEGMRFTQAYAACNVCSPTRASILTGKYPARLRLTDYIPGSGDKPTRKLKLPDWTKHLPLEETTIAEALKGAGYATAFIGKWHLGGTNFYPEHQGFDLNIAGCYMGQPPSYFSPYKIPTLKDGPVGEYLTDRLTDEAIKFMAAAKRPFFLYLSHYAVHNPQQAKTNLIEKYRAKTVPTGSEFVNDNGRQVRQVQNRPIYAAMMESLDDSVGRILTSLQELGLEKNTVVIFTSDNGGLSTSEGTPTSNVPLRMGKGWNYEGGIREPLIVKWPGVTKSGTACEQPMISMDYFPTFLEIAGAKFRESDGQSLVPLLKGQDRPDRPLFWHYPHYSNQGGGPAGAVRIGDFKLIEWFEDMRVELYNLREDLSEKNNLSAKMPEKVAELRNLLHIWRENVGAQMLTLNPDYKPN
jgi:arylsulfatase A-like enzyme